MIAPTCLACGRQADGVYDVSTELEGTMNARIPYCSRDCAGEGDSGKDELIVYQIFTLSDLELQSHVGNCWCNMRKTIFVPWCPVHGEIEENK